MLKGQVMEKEVWGSLMDSRVILLLLVIIYFFSFSDTSYAHPGNTDSDGGHTCYTNCGKWGLEYGEYHYHNSYDDNSFESYNRDINYDENSQCPHDYESAPQSVKNDCYDLSHQGGYWQGFIDGIYGINYDGNSHVYDEETHGILDEISFQIGYEEGWYEANDNDTLERETTSITDNKIEKDIENNSGDTITLLILIGLLILAIVLWYKFEKESNFLIFGGIILLVLFSYLMY